MNSLALLYHLMKADFLERVRRSSFLITLVGAMYLGYLYLPTSDAGYITVAIDNVRGIYNSAWIGAVCSLMSSTFLSLIGFYLVKNAVSRDYQTRVGQILAGTPMTKLQYLLGKTLSNFAVMAAVVMAIVVSAGIMQIIRGEDTAINVWQLVSPSLFFALPYLLVVSALAVLFEVTPVLRGVVGNVAYFFLWNIMLIVSLLPTEDRTTGLIRGTNDAVGLSRLLSQITASANAVLPNLKHNVAMGIQITDQAASQSNFVWRGVEWSGGLIGERLLWVAVALGIVLVASLIFRRFEAVGVSSKPNAESASGRDEIAGDSTIEPQLARLSTLTESTGFSWLAMFTAELRLMFRSVNRWWLMGAAVLVFVTLVTPMAVARQYIFPIAWIWPLAIWSSMGTREKKFGTEQLMFSCPRPVASQLPSLWLAGIAITVVTGAGMLIRFGLAGDVNGLVACSVGMVFIPTMALSFGVLSGSQLLFEGVYVALWYIGPMNHVPTLDFMGASPSITVSNSLVFLALIPLLMILAVVGRRRQLVR